MELVWSYHNAPIMRSASNLLTLDLASMCSIKKYSKVKKCVPFILYTACLLTCTVTTHLLIGPMTLPLMILMHTGQL